jgi:hypothetical protein
MIKTIIEWWPILKEDCDWDYSSILEILEFKLNKMADRFEKHGVTVGAKDRAGEMREAAKYCRLLINDDFFDHEKMDQKWGEPNFTTEDGRMNIEHANIKTDADREQYGRELLEEWHKEAKLRQGALDSLCGIIKNNLFGWWD